MFKFENNLKPESGKDEKVSSLQKIRNYSEATPIIKTIVLASVLSSGLELGEKTINKITNNKQNLEMEKGNEGNKKMSVHNHGFEIASVKKKKDGAGNHKINIKQEIEQENAAAEKYLIKRPENQQSSLSKMLQDNCFLSSIADEVSMENYGNLESLHSELYELQDVLNKSKLAETEDTRVFRKDMNVDGVIDNYSNSVTFNSNQADSTGLIKRIAVVDSMINLEEQKKKIAIEESRRKIIDLSILVEKAKIEVITHIQSKEYLNKLAKEMNITLEAAKEHQCVRINNVIGLVYDFQNSSSITYDSKGYAYYDPNKKNIVLPYNINLKNKHQNEDFYEASLHEILHLATQADMGMSSKSKNILEKSFKKNENYIDVEYYSQPLELIVRKQILDLEMEKMGVKKYGEKFTNEHYKKLLILKKENKLSSDAIELIDHIKPESFSKIMNDLAESNDNSDTYYYPGWEYNNKNTQA